MTIDEARQIVMSKFASTNSRANHVLPMRTLRFTVMQNLNREDQEIFVNGINELIQEGMITYEPPQNGLEVLRLTKQGYNELYQARSREALKRDIMSVFRQQNINPGQVLPMRYFIHNYVPSLNPKDQDQFTAACNELIEEGKLQFHDGADGGLNCFRLISY